VAAVDNPVRQSFVSEVVAGPQLPNAISLVSCTFQIGAMAGPVLGGLLMSTVGAGWAFVVNAASFVGPVVALLAMSGTQSRREVRARRHSARAVGKAPGIRAGLSYAARTPSVLWPVVMVGAFGFFTISLPVTLAAYAKDVFHSGASGLGLLNGVVALGALAGALTTARRRRQPRLRTVGVAGAALGGALLVAAAAPGEPVFLALLVPVGAANLGFLTSAQSLVQLAAVDHLRGRVIGLYMLVFVGSGAVGGPVVGWLAETFGARTALLASGAVPAVVTLLVCQHLARAASLRVQLTSVQVRLPRLSVVPRNHL
jgi:MFS family permease